MSAGGVSRRGATARDGVRADRDERARASRDARVKNLSASTRRVEGLEKYRRVDVAIAVSRAVGRERCAARGRVHGRRRGRRVGGFLTKSPIQSVRTSPSPVVAPFADILAAASLTPVANEDASTRATFISVSPCFGRWRARGRGPRKRARRRRRRDRDGSLPRARAENASSSRASRVPVRGSSAPRRKAAREAVRRRTTKAPLDSFRRHRTGGDDPCVGGSDCLSREFENFRFADSRVPRVFFSRRC